MAMMLKRTYDLLVLAVRLDASGREVEAHFELEAKHDGSVEVVREWRVPAEYIGVPERLDRSGTRRGLSDFRLPDDLLYDLRDEIARLGGGGRPLWLHLRKPYGYLGCVPWEALLVPALWLPVLRLPDFFERPPLESPRALEVVLCSSTPDDERAYGQFDHLGAIVDRILLGADRPATVHVFTDDRLGPALAQRDPSDRVIVHAPSSAGGFDPTREGMENAWFRWIRRVLAGRSVDVVHFMGHGYLARGRGALALSASPDPAARARWSTFVGDAEVDAFLTTLGAWGVAFSAAEGNYSELGLRFLADSIALRRPGAVLFHDWQRDGDGAALAEAYRFLFSVEPQRPPTSDAVFMYCQPFRVAEPDEAGSEPEEAGAAWDAPTRGPTRGHTRGPAPDGPEEIPEATPLEDAAFEGMAPEEMETAPNWLATTARYLEQQAFQISQTADTKRRGRPSGAGDTLRQIQDVMAKHSRRL